MERKIAGGESMNMKVDTYRSIKGLIKKSDMDKKDKLRLMQQLHDIYHFGQSVQERMQLKHPKIYPQWAEKHLPM